jgi:hypothetical protein
MEDAQAHIASEVRTNLLLLVVVPYSKTCRQQSINHPSIQPSSTSMLRLAFVFGDLCSLCTHLGLRSLSLTHG